MTARLFLLFLLLPGLASAVVLERRPYLQSTTETSTLLVWRTDVASTAEVAFGTDPTALDRTVRSDQEDPNHAVLLDGLAPGTTYYYSVTANGTLLASPAELDVHQEPLHRFTTSPPKGSSEPFRAWVVGDSGTGASRQFQVRDAMLGYVGSDLPDLFLHLGDMAYGDGTDEQFTSRFYAPYADILSNTPVWPTLGNHEGSTSSSREQVGPYYEGYHLPAAGEAGGLASGTEAYYSFDHANVHFVVLDSYDSDRSPDGPMLTWLAEDLASTDQDWLVCYFHHPPYTKGSHDSDRENELIEMRENALPILEAAGVDLVLAGHSHVYERSYLLDGAYETPSTTAGILDGGDGRPLGDGPYRKAPGEPHDGALYVVAGHGGTGVRAGDEHPLMVVTEPINGSVLLDFEDALLTVTNVQYTGEVSDRAVLAKRPAVIVGSPAGGERFRPGARASVVWGSTGDVGPVRLEFSCDDGETWETLVESTEDDGSRSFIVPEVETRAARVKIVPLDPSIPSDVSDQAFYVGRVGPYEDIPWGSVWSYWDAVEPPGAGWNQLGFNDSTWRRGRGEFGFADGDEETEVAARPVHPSYYFRKGFVVSDEITAAWLNVRFDDGFALYVDGVLVASANVDGGPAHDVGASSSSSDNQPLSVALPPSLLTPGPHVLAVVVKQHAQSVDLSFDASLEFTFGRSAALPCGAVPVINDAPNTDCGGCGASLAAAGGGLILLPALLGLRRRRRSALLGARTPPAR